VTADQDGAVGVAAQRVPVVPGRVALDLERQVGERIREPRASFRPGIRPRDALLAVLVAGQRLQLPEPRDDACGVECHAASLNGRSAIRANRMAPQTRRPITPSGHGPYVWVLAAPVRGARLGLGTPPDVTSITDRPFHAVTPFRVC
jgi:hypothetical protein